MYQQRSDCNNHRAVNRANADRHRLEATGIGGCACARHGCFYPHGMVDFQKGERYNIPIQYTDASLTIYRQENMDYALAHALQYNMDRIQRVVTFYDVNCQYNKKLRRRMKNNAYISLPSEVEIVPAIGAWHIHGHRQECLARYGASFIPGVGRVDGEIMETLWASLNTISPSARGMSVAHRQELLDYQMNDSNFLKMVRMSEYYIYRYIIILTE